jgi:hypothetical protein
MKNAFHLSCVVLLLCTVPAFSQEILDDELLGLPTTAIAFDESEYDFGVARQGEQVQFIFRFTNTGNEPLLLTNVRGSCGCTVPSWPNDPIEPGGTGAIVVEFDTKGKMGPQTKQVTITANTDPPVTLLYLKGEVLVEEGAELESPEQPLPKPAVKASATALVSVYPNPASDVLNLRLTDAIGQEVSLEIYNGHGQLVEKQGIAAATDNMHQLKLAQYEPGTYWLSVKIGDGERSSVPFVVSK